MTKDFKIGERVETLGDPSKGVPIEEGTVVGLSKDSIFVRFSSGEEDRLDKTLVRKCQVVVPMTESDLGLALNWLSDEVESGRMSSQQFGEELGSLYAQFGQAQVLQELKDIGVKPELLPFRASTELKVSPFISRNIKTGRFYRVGDIEGTQIILTDMGTGETILTDLNEFQEDFDGMLETQSIVKECTITRDLADHKGEYCLVSKDGKNLGCSKTEGEAKKREKEVEYFKSQGKTLEDIQKILPVESRNIIRDGTLVTSDKFKGTGEVYSIDPKRRTAMVQWTKNGGMDGQDLVRREFDLSDLKLIA